MIGSGGTYAGGDGSDHWVVAAGAGHSVITGFTPGQDVLTFSGVTPSGLAVAPATEGGVSGLSITFCAAGHSVFLAGIDALGPQDILFA